ncbi:MAG: PaaI family thioesterase [Proteobacteria bacterium]|nr:PaaI family thioesterase [Pseudomonadota bacterium]MBU2226491.1 PaaI family thioesterase [Pseudomonadota bacterium]
MDSALSDELKRLFNRAPFIVDLGIRLDSLGHGECTTVLPLQPRHLQHDGYVHAGVQATMADHTAGAAAATLLQAGRIVLTVEFKINLLRAAKGERLICRSRVLKAGRQFTVVESEIFCSALEAEQLVSKTTATMAMVAPQNG